MEDMSRLNCATVQGGEEQKASLTNMTSMHIDEARYSSDEVGRD